jgi:hypothetical protein
MEVEEALSSAAEDMRPGTGEADASSSSNASADQGTSSQGPTHAGKTSSNSATQPEADTNQTSAGSGNDEDGDEDMQEGEEDSDGQHDFSGEEDNRDSDEDMDEDSDEETQNVSDDEDLEDEPVSDPNSYNPYESPSNPIPASYTAHGQITPLWRTYRTQGGDLAYVPPETPALPEAPDPSIAPKILGQGGFPSYWTNAGKNAASDAASKTQD